MKVRTRFAPSPTGMLHIGNARTALINMLYARRYGGEFILRIDDTDIARSKKEYEEAIRRDLTWLGFNWDQTFSQSSRLEQYEQAKNKLIESGRLYACFETQDELEIKRKLQLSSGKPPIYDRAALNLTDSQKDEYIKSGRKPHYRFKLQGEKIEWQDLVKGKISFEVGNISDPILIREDGTMTYMISSTVDDVDYKISHIIRGEDHITNTAIQIQIFEALGGLLPHFAHLSLLKAKDEKISKRVGGFEIASLRDDQFIESMSINSFLANIGTSHQVRPYRNIEDIATEFDITSFSTSPTTYMPDDLLKLNEKIIHNMTFEQIKDRLNLIGAEQMDEKFWNAVKPNLTTLKDAKLWWDICHNCLPAEMDTEDVEYIKLAHDLFVYDQIDNSVWQKWTESLKKHSGRSGKKLFMPLRKALTAIEHGPELANLLPLIGRDEILRRLKIYFK